ncbi:hypothetical protein lbkm_1759 [Lachnospiraceae bacterium KM106-2]|nr:hypothetical protein lbkm_1759 [Lachnospiraceae bacterium KM106-2]
MPNQVDQTIHTKKNRSKRYHIATAVLVIAIVVSWVAAREIATQLNEKGRKERTVEHTVKPEQITIGEPFVYQGDQKYEVQITGAKVDDDKDLIVQDGFEMVAVSYQVTYQNQATDDYFRNEIYMEPYLITKSGEYLQPVSANDIEEGKGYDYDQSSKAGVSETFEYNKGVIYYLVKKDDVKGMWISSFTYDKGEYANSSLRNSYEIKSMEVKRP